jgi:type VI secretion system secreted protein Hcp
MAVDVFLKLGNIKGEAKDAKHPEWIEVLSWSWGMSQTGSMHYGTGGGAGKVNVSDLSIMKRTDIASTDIMLKCATGKHYPDATLVMRKAGDKPLEFLTIKMKEVLISSVQTSASSEEPMESLSLNFAEVNVKYVAQEASGAEGKSPDFTYNFRENQEKA